MSVLERVTRPRILHLSGDFPDDIEPFKTPVIKSHIDLTRTEFDHTVFSMNRQSPSFSKAGAANLKEAETPVLAIDTKAIGFGAYLAASTLGLVYHPIMTYLNSGVQEGVL